MPQKKSKKIPKFKSYAEEAHFWDTHDVTDYLGEMKEVDVEFSETAFSYTKSGKKKSNSKVKNTSKKPTKQETLIVRLQPAFKKSLQGFARKNHLSVSGLARIWLLEKLRESSGRGEFV